MAFWIPKAVSVVADKNGMVAVFRKSEPPVVWKLDLDRNHSFSLKLEEESGMWKLGIASPDGTSSNVAKFNFREDAQFAFETVQNELTKKRHSKIWTLVFYLIIVTVCGLLIYTGINISSRISLIKSLVPATSQGKKIPDGVPLPADSFLQPPTGPNKSIPAQPASGVPAAADDVLRPPN